MTAPLPLGRIVVTPGALELLEDAREHPFDLLARHASGDWGDLCALDRRQNEIALRDGHRIFSSYEVPAERVWIIIEADRYVVGLCGWTCIRSQDRRYTLHLAIPSSPIVRWP
jgi:hypothetical protein